MRVGVELAPNEVALEDEAPERARPRAAPLLGRGARLVEAGAARELGREHALARAMPEDARDADRRVRGVHVGEVLETIGLVLVVELLPEAAAHHLEHRLRVEAAHARHRRDTLEE